MLTTVAPPHANLARGQAAKRILEKAGPSFGKVFFTNGGADANENAIRMARLGPYLYLPAVPGMVSSTPAGTSNARFSAHP
jgi:acetylornithine/succinyldiaminopimelate/putrescine aminotransferase